MKIVMLTYLILIEEIDIERFLSQRRCSKRSASRCLAESRALFLFAGQTVCSSGRSALGRSRRKSRLSATDTGETKLFGQGNT
jgi:hypothetical protein